MPQATIFVGTPLKVDDSIDEVLNYLKTYFALTNTTNIIAAMGAARHISDACLQFTTVPKKYIARIPTEQNIWVTVHKAPRILGSL